MKVICPKCGRVVEKENVNTEKDYAFCTTCQDVFTISALLHKVNEAGLSEKIINDPPKGAWRYEDYDKKIIGATTRSPLAFFLVPFMMIWSGGSLGVIYVSQIISGEFDLYLSLFGIPFLAGSIVLLCVTSMAIAGKVEVVIGEDSYVFTGVGTVGIKKKFDWNSVVRIYEDKMIRNGFLGNDRYSASIFIEGKTQNIFVLRLTRFQILPVFFLQ